MAGALKNRADQGEMRTFVERIENCNRQKDSERGSYMQRCAVIQSDINSILDEAKDKGLSKKSVKAVVEARRLERKAAEVREDLEDDDAALFDDMREALGDFGTFGLGAAAVSQAEGKQDPTTAAIVGAVQTDIDKEAERKRIDEQCAKDAAEFDAAEAEKKNQAPKGEGGSISAKAARENRTRRQPPSGASDIDSGTIVF